jgi:hypothetical protein
MIIMERDAGGGEKMVPDSCDDQGHVPLNTEQKNPVSVTVKSILHFDIP